MATVSLKNVWKVYEHDNAAVRNVSLNIVDGEFMVLVGPSGCGKSTTLRMIAGLEDISSGTVEIDGRVVNDAAPRDRDIAMVFQSYALYPHMSVADNMTFALRIRNAPRELIEKRLAMAAEILGLTEYLDRKPRALSGGQRQRVAMGRAIVREPKVFLFDEPLSNLDAKMRVEMRREIVKLHRQVKATMVYVTHDQVEAMTLGDRICVMEKGIVRQVGTPGEVFVAGFIGTPPMNLLRGTIESEGERLAFAGKSVRAALPAELAECVRDHVGEEVVLGLRPKAFKLTGDAAKSWTAVPEFAELLGEESLVHARAGEDAQFIISLDPQKIPEMEKPFLIEPDMNKAHLFSAGTEMNLTLGLNLPGRYSVRR